MFPPGHHPCSAKAAWLEEQTDEDIAGYEDPVSMVRSKETFFKYNGNIAGTKLPRKNEK